MIYSIIETFATLIDIVFLLWFVPRFLNTRFYERANLPFLVFPALFLALQLTADFFHIAFDSIVAVGIITLVALYTFALCKKQWGKAILAASLYLVVIMLTGSLLYMALASLIENAAVALQGAASPARVIYLVIARAFQFAIYKLLLLFFGKGEGPDRKNGIALLLFTTVTICGLSALMAIASEDPAEKLSLPVFIVLFVLVLSNVGVYFFIHQILKMQKKAFEYKLLEERMHFEQARAEDANLIWDNIRKVRHDLKNHFIILKAKLADGKIDDCISYMEQIYPRIESMGDLVHTDNPTLDYLINTKVPEDKNVKVLVSGYTNVFEDLQDSDFASLIGNLLDNAFEAVSQIKSPIPKQVELHFLYKNQNRMIICRNTVESSVLANNQNLASSKAGSNHGLGHVIIETVAAKYNGFVSYTEKDHLFCVQVTLPMA